jgi:hypothetical protein
LVRGYKNNETTQKQSYLKVINMRINPTVPARPKNNYLTMPRNFGHIKRAAKSPSRPSAAPRQMYQTLRATNLDRFKFEGISFFGDILIFETCGFDSRKILYK